MTRARAAPFATAFILLGVVGMASVSSGAPALRDVPQYGTVLLFVVDGVSFEDLLSEPALATLAPGGGAALMATSDRYRTDREKVYEALGAGSEPQAKTMALMARTLCARGVDVYTRASAGGPRPPKFVESELAALLGIPCHRSGSSRLLVEWLPTAGTQSPLLLDPSRIQQAIRAPSDQPTLIVIVSPTASNEMMRRGDEVSPIVIGTASGGRGPAITRPDFVPALRSDTTRQTGLVANVDVAPTILDFFGIPIPAEMEGQPIEFTDDPAPFKLHRLHLEQRRIRLPIQMAEIAFVAASGGVAIVVLFLLARRRQLSGPVAETMRFTALCVAALPIPLMLGGLLPRLTYWVVVPFLVASIVGLAALARFTRWPGPLGPFLFLGFVGLAVLIIDASLGWRGARIPLIGGTMFDGARFYGLPNAFLCLLLASALFVAAATPAFTGFLLLVGAGLFAGFPSLGADIGGAITIFFAAGLWWILRTRRRLGVREVAVVIGVTVLGLGAVLLANRYLPGPPTHATRFVERAGGSLADRVHAYTDRLQVGIEQVKDVPAALIPLLGLLVVLALVVTRPGPIGWGLDRAGRRWQHVLIVLTVSGVVAFLANDTGVAAAAPVFLYAMAGMAYPAFLVASGARGKPGGKP